jgi:2-methylcitrate dehydratase PrpD
MLVNELGCFVAQLDYDALPPEVVEAAKLRILDLLAASLAGFHLGSHELLLPLLDGAPEATVWGIGRKLPLRDAALINSFVSHSQYLEDGSRYTGGHPSSVVIPAALTLAETGHASGKALIAAVVAGYEIFLRLGRAIYPSTVVRGFQSTAVLGAPSSAAACAQLLRFDPQQAKNALAIACNLGGGLKEALKSSDSQPIQVARSCEGGMLAAQLAGRGAAGADAILEQGFLKAYADDAHVDQILQGLGREYRITETYLKIHAGCRGNHAPVDAVLEAMRAHAIDPSAIRSIRVAVDTVTYAAEIHQPASGAEAQFSIAFSIAAALVEGNASIFQFTDRKVADPRVQQTMQRITVEVDKKLDLGYPDQRGAWAEITLNDGTQRRGSVDNARGEPEFPFSRADIEAKFIGLGQRMLGSKAAQVRDSVLALETLADASLLATQLGGTAG